MASDDQDLSDAIETAARAPKKVQEGDTAVEQQPLADQIEADRYLAAKRSARSGGVGLTYRKFVPPSAAGS